MRLFFNQHLLNILFCFHICFADFAGVAVENNTLFYAHFGDQKIYSASIDGSDKTELANTSRPWGLVIDRYLR